MASGPRPLPPSVHRTPCLWAQFLNQGLPVPRSQGYVITHGLLQQDWA